MKVERENAKRLAQTIMQMQRSLKEEGMLLSLTGMIEIIQKQLAPERKLYLEMAKRLRVHCQRCKSAAGTVHEANYPCHARCPTKVLMAQVDEIELELGGTPESAIHAKAADTSRSPRG